MIETNYFRDGNVESEILPEPTHGHEEREHTQEITDLIKRVEQKNFTEIQERGVLNRISKLSETPLEIIENNFKAFTLNFYKEYVISHQSIDLNGVAPLQGSINDKKYGYLWGLKREILSNIGDGIIGKFFEHQMLHNFGIQVHDLS